MGAKEKRNGILALIAGALGGLALAAFWMVIQESLGLLSPEFGIHTVSSTTYYLTAASALVGALLGGFLRDRMSERVVLLAGAVLSGGGCIAASFATQQIAAFTVCFAIVGGLGIGASVIACLCAVQGWMPARKGLGCGVFFGFMALACAFGGPALRFRAKLDGVASVLLILGCLIFVLLLAAALLTKQAPASLRQMLSSSGKMRIMPSAKQFTPMQILRSKQFYQLLICIVVAFSFYYMVSERIATFGELKGITLRDQSDYLTACAISVAVGSFGMGAFSDWLRRRPSLLFLFIGSVVGGFVAARLTGVLFTVGSVVASLAFGGLLAVFPAVVTDFYGEDHMGKNLSVGLCGYAAAALLLPWAASIFLAQPKGLAIPFEYAMLVPIVGVVFVNMLNRPTAYLDYVEDPQEEDRSAYVLAPEDAAADEDIQDEEPPESRI